jgi:hypothetical protein
MTLQAEGPTPACPSCRWGEKMFLVGGISIVSNAISDSCWNHGNLGHFGAMTVAAAPYCLSFAARSSSRDHGGLHHFTSFLHASSGRCRESTVSASPSLYFAL